MIKIIIALLVLLGIGVGIFMGCDSKPKAIDETQEISQEIDKR